MSGLLHCMVVITDNGYRYQDGEMERCHERKLSDIALAFGLVGRQRLPVHYGMANIW